jgi:RNA polymerase sigma-70 factor (ECF subfamily)
VGNGGLAGKDLLDHAVVSYYEDMQHAIRRRGLAAGQTADVVHDLYVLLSRNPDRLAGKSSIRAFLIRAAVNLGIDRARRLAFENRLFAILDEQAATIPAHRLSAEDRIMVRQRIMVLKDAIAELPHQCRTVFIAYRIGGMSKDEIAESLSIKRRMVDRHIRNALLSCLAKTEIFE